MDFLRSKGFELAIVERYNSFSRQRSDAFGILDLLAIRLNNCIGIQSTSQNCKSDHLSDLRGPKNEMVKKWLCSGHPVVKFYLITWSLCRAIGSGSKRKAYRPTITEFYLQGCNLFVAVRALDPETLDPIA